jgi:hypothetical protein
MEKVSFNLSLYSGETEILAVATAGNYCKRTAPVESKGASGRRCILARQTKKIFKNLSKGVSLIHNKVDIKIALSVLR